MEPEEEDNRGWIAPGRRIADVEWVPFFLLVTVAVALGAMLGIAGFYYILFRNIGP